MPMFRLLPGTERPARVCPRSHLCAAGCVAGSAQILYVGLVERFERVAWIPLGLGGLVMGGLLLAESVAAACAVAAAMLLLAWWMAPWRGGRSVRHDDIAALPAERRQVVAYWRPGCAYCTRLRRAVGTRRSAVTWVNIWQDRAAEDFVRSVNDGDATVPTVVIDGEAMTNPNPQTVRRHLN